MFSQTGTEQPQKILHLSKHKATSCCSLRIKGCLLIGVNFRLNSKIKYRNLQKLRRTKKNRVYNAIGSPWLQKNLKTVQN